MNLFLIARGNCTFKSSPKKNFRTFQGYKIAVEIDFRYYYCPQTPLYCTVSTVLLRFEGSTSIAQKDIGGGSTLYSAILRSNCDVTVM